MDVTKVIKITFTGDIMCEMQTVHEYKTGTGEYDFSEMFKECKHYFASSDYVVGNLETPIANAAFSNRLYEFNNPVEFAKAVKDIGVSMVTTANNHCLDRGVSGLEDTIKALDEIGLPHTGTQCTNTLPSGIIETIGGMRVGFLSYTYGTNAFLNHHYLKKDSKWKVNLYQEQELHNPLYRRFYKSRCYALLKKIITRLSRFITSKNLFPPVWERTEKSLWHLKRMKNDIQALRNMEKGPEYVIMCLHAGGQFNKEPLRQLKKIADKIATMGVDAVIINHEHVVHSGVVLSGRVITYSLGNFISDIGVYQPPFNTASEYSILFNLYLTRTNGTVRPIDFTFSITKVIPDGKNRVKTVLLFDLINTCTDANERAILICDNLKVYNLFRNSNEPEIPLKLEYKL